MSHNVLPSGLPGDDTPGEGVDRRPRIVLAVIVAAIVFLLLAVTLIVRRARRAWRDRTRAEVIMFPASAEPYQGPAYPVEFYDGTYRQLADVELRICLPQVHGPHADEALDRMARRLRADVEAHDSQRCFAPRVVVLDETGRRLRTWSVAR